MIEGIGSFGIGIGHVERKCVERLSERVYESKVEANG